MAGTYNLLFPQKGGTGSWGHKSLVFRKKAKREAPHMGAGI